MLFLQYTHLEIARQHVGPMKSIKDGSQISSLKKGEK